VESWNERLTELKQKMRNRQKWEDRLQRLNDQAKQLRNRVVELEIQLEKENEDVEKLMRLSWANLFHTLLRSKEEQLELERQQALAAALRLQETRQALKSLEDEIADLKGQLAGVIGADAEYERLLRQKEEWMRAERLPSVKRLAELDESIADFTVKRKEIREAADAGRRLQAALRDVEQSLSDAKKWGTWDMLGGGMISTAVKHSHIDRANERLRKAEQLMHRFEQELADVHRTVDLGIEVGGFVKFADYFFDGLISDWVVQRKISDSLEHVRAELRKVDNALRSLENEERQAEAELERLKNERIALIEGAR